MSRFINSKYLVILALIIGLQFGLTSITGVIRDRQSHRSIAEYDITKAWAGPQQIAGPLLVVPFTKKTKESRYNLTMTGSEIVTKSTKGTNYLVPTKLAASVEVAAEERYRGIYSFPVYQAMVTLQGEFQLPAELQETENTNFEFESSSVLEVSLSDARGFVGGASVLWDDASVPVLPGTLHSKNRSNQSGVHAKVNPSKLSRDGIISFEISFEVKGIKSLQLAALGKDNTINVSGNWPHPKFIGDFLPSTREIDATAFEASWSLNYFATDVLQTLETCSVKSCSFDQQLVGFELFEPVDLYHLSERSLKYGILFIFLTFGSFLIFETLKSLQIHPIQYAFVGGMQAIFYLLLLSLSEHVPYALAYTLATLACVGVLTGYLNFVLQSRTRGLSYGVCFAVLYAFLYFVLSSTEYALLLGSGLLFSILAVTMLATRRTDWYALQRSSKGSRPEAETIVSGTD